VALLEVVGLTVRRGTRCVLDGLDLSIDVGECVVLTGENGSGKSTLIESIAGLLPVHSGSIEVARPFGLTLQSGGMNGDELVCERLEYAAASAGLKADDSLLAHWGLAHRTADRIGHLSGGLRRRLAVLQGLMAALGDQPRLCLLDEPSEGLDEASIQTLLNDINSLRARGHAFLIATHDARLSATATHTLTPKGEKLAVSNEAIFEAAPLLEEVPAQMLINRWSARLDRRTNHHFLSRGLPFIASILVLYALLGQVSAQLVLVPTFLAALAPLTSLHHAKEARSGDWWRAMGGCLSVPEPLTSVLICLAPWATMAILGIEVEGNLVYFLGLPFLTIMLASGAIHELALRLPRAGSQYIPLLTLVLIWPLLIATDALTDPEPWRPLVLATGIGLVISIGLPALHPRTGSD
jgi:ABC-type Mn2+/Zn2+ transport system ATPase subunit